MSNYTINENSCRVDFWKESGKWYTTEAVIFRDKDYDNSLIHDALRNALADHEHCKNHYLGMRVTCLDPYHKYSHPISIIWNGIEEK